MSKQSILYRTDLDIHAEIKSIAKTHGYSMSRLLSILVEEQLKRYREDGLRAVWHSN